MLDVGNQVDVAHDWNLENLLAAISHNSKHEVVIGVEKPLIEEGGRIKNSQVDITLNIRNIL